MRALYSITVAAVAFFATPAFAQEAVSDPMEGFNRSMFSANEAVDKAVFEPVARGYRAITISPVRAGVRNFLRNLRAPVVFVNDVLQGEPSRAGATAGRFAINTTVGILGLFDVAQHAGLTYHDEDFGQTLAVWGVGTGPYIFLPLLGPTNLRDGTGRIVDIAFSPLTWAEFDHENTFTATRVFLGGVSAREELLETIDSIRSTSLDPYVTIRSSYALTRESAIRNGPQDASDLPEFDSIDEAPVIPEAPAEPSTDAAPATIPAEPTGPGTVGEGVQGIPQ